ncbi:protein MpNAC9 [Marchantia polymorpha subsp. ruderalis]|uniref:NAC domain-containing protein n=4 Tax=Marchantia polymorpha TaxID=3197 RepID=A0AAF6BG88_MARPO|nr:hypothetical protein MARPO_0086s0046 [Marchantia polymorpha]BBN11022.1 hypothetical protein Mp_5g08410 [Marchantia polymorpha subsp. ruderalis]|eukprot:PTQ33722.1 hypothetical protein MARPO_0086s0046 [Marchantia polymorpha]
MKNRDHRDRWGRFMDQLVRQIDNATHQRNDAYSLAQDDTTALPGLEVREDCPSCGHHVGRRTAMDWVGLPAGVRFDPSDEELLRHLAAKVGVGKEVSHPRIDDFISHLDGNDGICQTHPENLPGVKTDGSSRHFFHKPAKAYTTGTRKRRKIHNEDEESGVETRWHKTGKTRPVLDGGQHLGWKKIMVLYRNLYSGKKKAKSEKTNWILHQYHLGPEEEERDGELVVCKVFFQKQPRQCTGGKQYDGVFAEGNSSKAETCQPQPRSNREIVVGASVSDVSRGTLITPKRDAPVRPQFSRHRTREASPPVQAPPESVTTRTPTQSGRGSEMTVMGKSDHLTSELTSTLGISHRLPQSLTPCVKTGSLQSGGLVQSVPFEELFSENGSPDLYEEVSTSGKSCQNENAMAAVEYPPRDDYHEQPYPVMDTEGNVIGLTDLECDEELLPISWDWDANLDIEGGGGVDGLLDTPYHFNPHTDYFYTFDEYLLRPEINFPGSIGSDEEY